MYVLPYSRKYWRNLNLAMVPHSVLHHHEHCRCVYTVYVSGSAACRPWSHLEDLNKAMSLQIYKKYNWQHACAKPGMAKSATASNILHTAGENNIGGFEFGGFNLDWQTAKFNFPSNFPAIQYVMFYTCRRTHTLCINSSHFYNVKCIVVQARPPPARKKKGMHT